MKESIKKHRITIIVAIVSVIVGVGFGRYATPEKVVTKIEEVEVERVVLVEKKVFVKEEVKKTAKRQNTKTLKTTKPDGTIIEETVTSSEDITFADSKSKEGSEKSLQTENTKKSQESKQTDFDTKRLKVSALVGVQIKDSSNKPLGVLHDIRNPDPVFGIHASYNFFGPISVGAFGLTSRELGVSIGFEF